MQRIPGNKITRPFKLFLLLVVFFFLLAGFILIKARSGFYKVRSESEGKEAIKAKEEKFCGFVGEKIVYDVKLGGVNLGKAVFQHVSRVKLDGKEVNFMTFQTSLARFNDLEKIYSDLSTFLPIKVERDISTWINHENITETYDQDKFTLNITKSKGRNRENLAIKKDGPMHNAILLPFHVRMIPDLNTGFSMAVRLPTLSLVSNSASTL